MTMRGREKKVKIKHFCHSILNATSASEDNAIYLDPHPRARYDLYGSPPYIAHLYCPSEKLYMLRLNPGNVLSSLGIMGVMPLN